MRFIPFSCHCSTDCVVFRELTQNADDSHATHVEFHIKTSRKDGAAPTSGTSGGLVALEQVTVSNNGDDFTDQDFKRLAVIASGNSRPDSVGQFGVGFYTVFCLTETPEVHSAGECLRFEWAANQLKTKR
jgi:HSP90 family molecular chaperone